MVRDTHLNFRRNFTSSAVGLALKERAFSLTSFETQSSSCYYIINRGFRSFNLFSKVSPGSE